MVNFSQDFVNAHQRKMAAGKRPAHIVLEPKERFMDKKPTKSKPASKQRNGYNTAVVLAYFKEMGLPEPIPEYKFHPDRKWRFDFAWGVYDIVDYHRPFSIRLALECQGGIFSGGRHVRGAALLKEWEKLNEACILGYRVLYVQPSEICMASTVELIKKALGI